MTDVVVAGGGVVGSAVAFELAQRGLAVTLVSPFQAGGTASAAAGAMLGALGETTAAGPDDDLAVRLAAADRYDGWLDRLGEVGRQRPTIGWGTYVVAGGRAALDAVNLAAIGSAAAAHGRRTETVPVDQVPGWRPAPDHPGVGALYLADEGWVDARALLAALEAALRHSPRLSLVDGTVAALAVDRGRCRGVELTGGTTIEAPAVVLSAGCATQSILDATPALRGLLPRIVPGKGVALTLTPPVTGGSGPGPTAVLRTPNREFACGLHLVPGRDGGVYLGATNRIASRMEHFGGPTVNELRYLMDRCVAELDSTMDDWQPAAVLSGNRPISADGRPLAGQTDAEGLLVATGTYRNGILLAPVLAEVVADELLDPAVRHPYSARNRTAATNALGVLDMGLADLSEWVAGGDSSADLAEDLRHVLGALFEGVLDPDGRGADVRSLVERSLGEVPIPEILPELLVLLRQRAQARRSDTG